MNGHRGEPPLHVAPDPGEAVRLVHEHEHHQRPEDQQVDGAGVLLEEIAVAEDRQLATRPRRELGHGDEEQRPEDRPLDAREPPDHDHDRVVEGDLDGERVLAACAEEVAAERAGDRHDRRRHGEGDQLRARDVDAEQRRAHVALAHGGERAPHARPREVGQEQHDDATDRQQEEVPTKVGVDHHPLTGLGADERQAGGPRRQLRSRDLHAAEPEVVDEELLPHESGDEVHAERGEQQVRAAKTQRRQPGDDADHDAGDRRHPSTASSGQWRLTPSHPTTIEPSVRKPAWARLSCRCSRPAG